MFAGYLGLPSAPCFGAGAHATARALAPRFKPDLEGIWTHEACRGGLIAQRVYNATESRDITLPAVCPESGAALAFWGRLDNRAALAVELGIEPERLASLTDQQLLLPAWRRWGEALPRHLLGDFALAVIDPKARQAFLARDALGVKPLYYALVDGGLVFATAVPALLTMVPQLDEPDPDWVARFVISLSRDTRSTAYRRIVKLPPAHSSLVGADGREQLARWHRFVDDAPDARQREDRWVEAYRDTLETTIRCRMGSEHPLGSENSGGLDSGTITAYLAHFLGEPGDRLHSFGFAHCDQEPEYILETSRAKKITHNYIVTARAEGGESQVDESLRILGYPEEHGNGSHHLPFYQQCDRVGVRTLFSGFGGDEVGTNPGNLLRRELADSGRYAGLWELGKGNALMRTLRLGRSVIRERRRLEYREGWFETWSARWPHQTLRPEVVRRLDLQREYMETARFDGPYRRINDFILQHLLEQPYISARFESCTLHAAAWGIEYRWPLWDPRLVQQYLSTPSIEKYGPGGVNRYLHRRAATPVVPHKVCWKPSKDMGYARIIQESNQAQAAMPLLRSELERLHPLLRELLDLDKLAALAGPGQDTASAFQFGRQARAILQLNRWLTGAGR